MNIIIVSSELAPFASTGGLGESVSQLATTLSARGQSVTVIVPYYRQLFPDRDSIPEPVATGVDVTLKLGHRQITASVLKTRLPGTNCQVLLIDYAAYYDRPQIYHDGIRDYRDNSERFIFFSRAAVETIRTMKLNPDVVHCHDWQTGLIPALLKVGYRGDSELTETASVLTVHNIAYQGQFWHWDMELTGLDWKYFNWRQMEFFGQLNLLKTGIVFADAIVASSPEYARAIQTPEHGCGLHGVLRTRYEHVIGVSGGIEQYLEIYRYAMRRDDVTQLCST